MRRLVLTAASAGVNMAALGRRDWRPIIASRFPRPSAWITETRSSLELPVEKIAAPTLLIWGDADAISPLAVGRHLEQRIPDARLHVVPGGDHDLAETHAARWRR